MKTAHLVKRFRAVVGGMSKDMDPVMLLEFIEDCEDALEEARLFCEAELVKEVDDA